MQQIHPSKITKVCRINIISRCIFLKLIALTPVKWERLYKISIVFKKKSPSSIATWGF